MLPYQMLQLFTDTDFSLLFLFYYKCFFLLLTQVDLRLQVAGIRFLWENIIQSIGKARSGDKGLGCILAHMMGLGKTFQVLCSVPLLNPHPMGNK